MDADATLSFDELDFDSQTLGALRQTQVTLKLDEGVLVLSPFTAQVAGGTVRGSSQLDGTQSPARWVAKLDLQKIDIAGWVRGVRKDGAGAPPKGSRALARERREARDDGNAPRSYVTGVLDADIDAQGSGFSTASILGSLDGRAQVRLRDGTLSHLVTEAVGLDLAQALGVAFKGDEALPLRCGVLDLAMKDGRVAVQRGVLDRDSTIHIGGRLSLRDESLELVARARPKDASFASLRSPVTVTGPFNAPRVGIEAPKVAGRVIGAVILGAIVAPVAALLPLIDLGEKPKTDPCA
jgi:AsmA family protein